VEEVLPHHMRYLCWCSHPWDDLPHAQEVLQPVCRVEDLVTGVVDAQQDWKARHSTPRKGKAVSVSLYPLEFFLLCLEISHSNH